MPIQDRNLTMRREFFLWSFLFFPSIKRKKGGFHLSEYQLVSDYRHNEKYRESFFELAREVFSLNFQEWYDQGCWNDNYICYSYVDRDRVIANASVNKLVVISQGKEYKAIQIGTVMTHPDYRQQGLSAKLMRHILANYEKDYDFMYLFANETVLDFYPKFGFERAIESSFHLNTSELKKQLTDRQSALRKLDISKEADFELMKEFAAHRVPVSSVLSAKNAEHLLMFYFILAFPDEIYYSEEDDIIVLMKEDEQQLHLYDLISKKEVEIMTILRRLISPDTASIHFYFTPDFDCPGIQATKITDSDDQLFVRPFCTKKNEHFLFPLTSHA